MSHLVEALIEDPKATVICPADHGVGGGVLADVRSSTTPGRFGHFWFGHFWLDRPGMGPFPEPELPGESRRYICFTQVLPAVEAEKEAIST